MDSTLVIVEKINSFYSSAFSQLITITVLMIAFIGIIVPVIFYLYQQRLFRIEVHSIEDKINIKFGEIKNELKEVIINTIDEQMKEAKKSLENDYHSLRGDIFLVQANHYVSNSRYIDSLDSYLTAGVGFIKCKDELNLKTTINNIIGYSLPSIESSQIKDNENIENDFNNFINLLNNELNKTGAYTVEIRDMKSEFKKAKVRIKTERNNA
jgi:hypothetical protein